MIFGADWFYRLKRRIRSFLLAYLSFSTKEIAFLSIIAFIVGSHTIALILFLLSIASAWHNSDGGKHSNRLLG